MSIYDNDFYEKRHNNTVASAEKVLTIVQGAIPKIQSAVDLGCGVGTWLSVLIQRGASDVCGIDGPWVNKRFIKLGESQFIEHDFSKDPSPRIGRRFDLAISLEVAEHLSENSAKQFVATLCGLSDFVLFSAAIPYQGGQGHINEQWPNYWISIFSENEYIGVDIVRKYTWNDSSVKMQYRQNSILFVKKARVSELSLSSSYIDHIPAEQYSLVFEKAVTPGIKKAFAALLSAIRSRIKT